MFCSSRCSCLDLCPYLLITQKPINKFIQGLNLNIISTFLFIFLPCAWWLTSAAITSLAAAHLSVSVYKCGTVPSAFPAPFTCAQALLVWDRVNMSIVAHGNCFSVKNQDGSSQSELQNACFQITAKIMPKSHFLQQLRVKDRVCVCVCCNKQAGKSICSWKYKPQGVF